MHINEDVKAIPTSITWTNSIEGIALELERANLS